MAVAIARKYFMNRNLRMDFDDSEEAGGGFDGIDEDLIWHHLQAHSARTANLRYGRTIDLGAGLGDDTVAAEMRACREWYRFLGFDSQGKLASRKHLRQESGTAEQALVKTKRSSMTMPTHRVRSTGWSSADVQAALDRAVGKDGATYRSEEQRRLIEAITVGKPFVIGILATGGGKSLAFSLPACLRGARTTIVVVPLVSLKQDLFERMRKLRIRCENWEDSGPACYGSSIVLVSAESASSDPFLSFTSKLHGQQELDRIVVDESHLVLTDSDYRPQLRAIRELRQFEVQFVLLTATLPPSVTPKLAEEFYSSSPLVIRQKTTNRWNHFYFVTELGAKHWDRSLENICRSTMSKAEIRERCAVYVQEIAEARKWAERLECEAYYSSAADKRGIFERWREGKHHTIVATTALMYGIDVPFVKAVYFIGAPRKLSEFIQGAGRAGRAGASSRAGIFVRSDWGRSTERLTAGSRTDESAMEDFIESSECRRTVLGVFMDGGKDETTTDCRSAQKAEAREAKENFRPCDNCVRKHQISEWKFRSPKVKMAETGGQFERRELGQGRGKWATEKQKQSMRLEEYKLNLDRVLGRCMLCAVRYKDADRGKGHELTGCPNRGEYFDARRRAMAKMSTTSTKGKGKEKEKERRWFDKDSCCFGCYQPKRICESESESEGEEEDRTGRSCRYRDMLLPGCFEAFQDKEWVSRHLKKLETSAGLKVEEKEVTEEEYFRWLGQGTVFSGMEGHNGCFVLEDIFRRFL
ncbi:hypothetical protein TWF970_001623 [Orbilia oligospora]|uniref:DNA 3'-5' helicase n=1 Tax=Orbilia oligospora TaxID=2813651 RepID=A0A7C8V4C2_ORBOL|nr:hypothetical protein TWF970_001623 [Orbilia oligospora]